MYDQRSAVLENVCAALGLVLCVPVKPHSLGLLIVYVIWTNRMLQVRSLSGYVP